MGVYKSRGILNTESNRAIGSSEIPGIYRLYNSSSGLHKI